MIRMLGTALTVVFELMMKTSPDTDLIIPADSCRAWALEGSVKRKIM
jgi:hypothetical protein